MATKGEVDSMKKVRIRSMDDLRALPEGEWFEAVDGLRWNVGLKTVMKATEHRVHIDVPTSARAGFPFRDGEKLEATLRGGVLTVKRPARGKGKRKPTG
jgi:hypothetical protein